MKRILIVILTLFLALPPLCGQRVGVVFSGGGAKGLYHVGILKALEENRIPVDYIAGTSMGAIIAGLYAIGYTPDEMAELFLSDQLRLWMSGRIESDYSFYFNRMHPRQDMFTLNLDFGSDLTKAVIPTSLYPPVQLDMAFNEIFNGATGYSKGNFDGLMIPFRCVASDTYNKREVVFRQGDIGRAIRASMAIPGIFPGQEVDSLLLYDGGIYNNFPWEPLEEDFRPDVFIGGKCIQGLQSPQKTSIVELLETLVMMHTDFDLPEGRGVMIERVFDDVGMLDFERAQYVMDLGYADAMAQMDSIRMKITRRQDPEALLDKRLSFRSQLPELVFSDYRVGGLMPDQARYVRRMLGFDDGEARYFTYREFKSAYFKILSEGEILGDYPEMVYDDSTGFFTVNLPLRTKPSFRVKFGGNISSASLQQAYIGLEYKTIASRAHSFRFDGNFSGLYTALRTGWRTDFYLKLPVYCDLFVNYERYNYGKGPNWNVFSRYGYHGYDDMHLSASLGLPWGLRSAIQFRFNLADNKFKYYERNYIPREFGSSDETRFRYYGAQIELSTNSLNYSQYATRGILQSLSAIFVSGRERFSPGDNYIERDADGLPLFTDEKGEAVPGITTKTKTAARRWIGARYMREGYYPLFKWLTMGYHIDAVFTTQPDFYTEHAANFVSPGFTPTPYSQSLYMDKFRSRTYLGVGVLPVIELANNLYLKNSLHVFASEKLLDGGFRMKDKVRYIINSSLVYQTPIGPASLTMTNFEERSRAWFVAFNFGFTLFNRRGLFY